jgi:SAM-dependent methyltransferase
MHKLNLGSGNNKIKYFINIDISSNFLPDIIADIERGLPFKDDSFDEVFANHVIEHLSDTIFAMNEIYRVCKNGARIIIEVPYQCSDMAFADPTHKKIFNKESFKYFCSNCEHYWIHTSYGIKSDFSLVMQEFSYHTRYGYLKVELIANKPPRKEIEQHLSKSKTSLSIRKRNSAIILVYITNMKTL